ncbi:MAG TPA: AraC family transcriptional regulator [Xanthomonadales bacterium]|nr:AraC family transcriptional regulator [Xanthomonadales bacterium]
MMLLNKPPGPDEPGLTDYYRRCATEGSVFSGTVSSQSYGLSDSFDPAWSVAAICWCAGATETYEFLGHDTIHLTSGAVLAIGENERYAYTANSELPFMSSMIVFPRAMTRSLNQRVLDDECPEDREESVIATGLFKPGRQMMMRLNVLTRAAQASSDASENAEEQAAMVAAELLATQNADARRPDQLDSVKRTTREELCRRLKRAVALMNDAYDDSTLSLGALAREACIARHHFVRIFSAAYGTTPLRYLGEIRMEAAARLLEAMDISTEEVSQAVGFTNRSAFHRRFKSYFGMTPRGWRTQVTPH